MQNIKNNWYLFLALIEWLIVPFLFPFNFFMWLWFIIFSLLILYFTNKIIKNKIPYYLGVVMMFQKKGLNPSENEVHGIYGLTTSLYGFFLTLFMIGYSFINIDGLDFIPIFVLGLLFYLILDRRLNNKIWDMCIETSIKVKKIYTIGFIIPIIMGWLLYFINTEMLTALSDSPIPALVVLSIYFRHLANTTSLIVSKQKSWTD